jgi:hypothetical protein
MWTFAGNIPQGHTIEKKNIFYNGIKIIFGLIKHELSFLIVSVFPWSILSQHKIRKGKKMIQGVSFGSIVIDGRKYHSDLIIYPDGRVKDSWRRHMGHRLSHDDIEALIASNPEIIVAGTGISGMMKPANGLEQFLEEKNIAFSAAPNEEAAILFNQLERDKRIGACFHLTC